jgi:hypothetical protein
MLVVVVAGSVAPFWPRLRAFSEAVRARRAFQAKVAAATAATPGPGGAAPAEWAVLSAAMQTYVGGRAGGRGARGPTGRLLFAGAVANPEGRRFALRMVEDGPGGRLTLQLVDVGSLFTDPGGGRGLTVDVIAPRSVGLSGVSPYAPATWDAAAGRLTLPYTVDGGTAALTFHFGPTGIVLEQPSFVPNVAVLRPPAFTQRLTDVPAAPARRFAAPPTARELAAVAADGSLALTCFDACVLLSPDDGTVRATVPFGGKPEVTQFSPDGRRLFFSGNNLPWTMLDLVDRRGLVVRSGPGTFTPAVAWFEPGRVRLFYHDGWLECAPDGSNLRPAAAPTTRPGGAFEDSLRRFDPFARPGPPPSRPVATTPDGRTAAWLLDRHVYVYRDNQLVSAQGHALSAGVVALSPDGALAAASGSGEVWVWQLTPTGTVARLSVAAHRPLGVTFLNERELAVLRAVPTGTDVEIYRLGDLLPAATSRPGPR